MTLPVSGKCHFGLLEHHISKNQSYASVKMQGIECAVGPVLQNKLNINDWSSVQSLFDKLNKQMEKAQKATESLGAPRVYIKMLVELEVCPVATF